MKITRGSDALATGVIKSKVLIYGSSGNGKTWLSATASKPLIILTEANGATSAAHANPDCLIVEAHNFAEIRNIMGAIQQNRIDAEFDTIVFDSLTEIQRMIKDDIAAKNSDGRFTLADWGTLGDTFRTFIRFVRNLNYHIVATALVDKGFDESTGQRFVQPQFAGRVTSEEICQWFNAVGFVGKKQESDSVSRFVIFDGGDRYVSKPTHPLPNLVMCPNMAEIQQSIMTGKPLTTNDK